jgi:hypothetical protein
VATTMQLDAGEHLSLREDGARLVFDLTNKP